MKHKISRNIILISAVVVILLAGTIAFANSGTFDFFGLGKKDKEIQLKDDSILVVVEGKYEITKNQVERAIAWSSAFNEANRLDIKNNPDLSDQDKEKYLADLKPKTKDEIITTLIRNKVVLAEAERRGIVIPDEQAEKFILDNYKAYEEILKSGDEESKASAKKVMDMQDALLLGMGKTRDEYMKESQIPAMKDVMTRQALSNIFVATLPPEKQNDLKAIKAAYEAFVDELVKTADINWISNN